MKTERLAVQFLETPQGCFRLEASAKGLTAVDFPVRKASAVPAATPAQRKVLRESSELLKKYLSGQKVSFRKLKFDLTDFSPYQQKVLRNLAGVEWGKVTTYQELAKLSGSPRSSRAVGNVMNKNRIPVLLPCHRVLRSGGGLGGYAKGLGWKKRLLALEQSPS